MSLIMLPSERKPFSQSGNIIVSAPILTILFHAQHFVSGLYDPVRHVRLLQLHDERRQNAFVFSLAPPDHGLFTHVFIGIAHPSKETVRNLITIRFAENA